MKTYSTSQTDPDLDALLHPAQAFEHPRDVVGDADLTVHEKREILASWVSDACAVEAAPALRCAPGGRRPVSVDEILEALCDLDRETAESSTGTSRCRNRISWQSSGMFRTDKMRGRAGPDHGPSH